MNTDTDQIVLNVEVHVLSVYDKDDNDVTHKYLNKGSNVLQSASSNEQKQSNEELQLVNVKLDSVLSRFEQMTARMDGLQEQIDGIQLMMNDEQKEDSGKLNMVITEMAALRKEVKELKLQQQMNPEQEKLKSWLENTVKLPEYFDIFMDGGIEDLETVSMLTKNELNDIGISKVGHQVKILGAARKLKVQQTDVMVEGDTLHI